MKLLPAVCVGILLTQGMGSALADSLGYEVRGSDIFYGKRVYAYVIWQTQAEKIPNAEGAPLPGADPRSFRVDAQQPSLACDRRQVYLNRSVIHGVDPATYELQRGASVIGRDLKGFYFGPEPVAMRDLSTFEVITADPAPGATWAKDSKAFYVGAKTIGTSKGSKLEILGEGYSKDAKRVFYKDEGIEGADAATFTVRIHKDDLVKGQRFVVARDCGHFYTSDTPTCDMADGATFKELGRGYSRDSRQVYYLSSVVEGADPASFSTTEVHGVAAVARGAPVVRDKNSAYQFGNALNTP
jgi:hypothetical protein